MESEERRGYKAVKITGDPKSPEIIYFMEKFHVSKAAVEEAIRHIGDSSEMLEQYFTEQKRKAPF